MGQNGEKGFHNDMLMHNDGYQDGGGGDGDGGEMMVGDVDCMLPGLRLWCMFAQGNTPLPHRMDCWGAHSVARTCSIMESLPTHLMTGRHMSSSNNGLLLLAVSSVMAVRMHGNNAAAIGTHKRSCEPPTCPSSPI